MFDEFLRREKAIGETNRLNSMERSETKKKSLQPGDSSHVELAVLPAIQKADFDRDSIRSLNELRERLRSLTPVGRRLLRKVHRLLEVRDFEASVNRVEIAVAIQHKCLQPHDVKLLRELVDLKFISAVRVPLSMQRHRMARGYEWRYSMDFETGKLIRFVLNKLASQGAK